MTLRYLLALPLAITLAAQTPKATTPVPKAADSKTAEAKAAELQSAQTARKALEELLLAVDSTWFGEKYKDFNAVDMQGTLSLIVSSGAINTKVEQATQGVVKGPATKSGNANLKIKSTYFANADFKTEMTGDFGNLIYTRVGNKGYIYSKERNAYTTRVDMPPADAPLTFMTWFRETLLDIKAVYVTSNTFQATAGKEDKDGRVSVTFNAPTSAYDPKKREQSIAESLGFWKRGRLELTYSKGTKLPVTLIYANEANGIRAKFDFTYDGKNRIQNISIANQSRGFEGPGFLRLTYNPDGMINAFAGELNRKDGKISWDLGLAWTKERKSGSIASVPPPTATKMGGDEFETSILVAFAGQMMDLQRNGWNIMAPKLASK